MEVLANRLYDHQKELYVSGFDSEPYIEEVKKRLPLLNKAIGKFIELTPVFEDEKLKQINYQRTEDKNPVGGDEKYPDIQDKLKLKPEEIDFMLRMATSQNVIISPTNVEEPKNTVLMRPHTGISSPGIPASYNDVHMEDILANIRSYRINKLDKAFSDELSKTGDVSNYSPTVITEYYNVKNVEREIVKISPGSNITRDETLPKEQILDTVALMAKHDISNSEIPETLRVLKTGIERMRGE